MVRIFKKSLILIFIALLLVLIGKLFLSNNEKQIEVLLPVKQQDLQTFVFSGGQIKAFEQIDIGTQISGQLKKIHVKEGQYVGHGDLLAEIDPEILENSLKQSESDYEVLKSRRDVTQQELQRAILDLERYEKIIKSGALSEQTMKNTEFDVNIKRSQIAQVDSEIDKAQITVNSAKTNLSFSRIKAPIKGVILEVLATEGQTLIASQQAPLLMRLADLTKVTIELKISEMDILNIKDGDPVSLSVYGKLGKTFEGVVDRISLNPIENQGAIYYNAYISIENNVDRLIPGLNVAAKIITHVNKNSYTIDNNKHLKLIPEKEITLNVKNKAGIISSRTVQLGKKYGEQFHVVKGLELGDTVIVSYTATSK